jgi:hypothetical protein
MLSFIECADRNVLKVMASGELNHADQMAFFDHLHALFAKRGKVRVLWELKDWKGVEGRTSWDDPAYVMRYTDVMSRLAIVCEVKVQSGIAWMASGFANVRFFRPTERVEAWRWVTEGVEETAEKECIGRLAYAKWEKAGRPPGDGVPFWLAAEHEIAAGMGA